MILVEKFTATKFYKKRTSGYVVVSNGNVTHIIDRNLADKIYKTALENAIKAESQKPEWSRLIASLLTVWQQIAPDVSKLCETSEERTEMCYDADRIVLSAEDSASQFYIRELFRVYGIEPIRKALAVRLSL